MYVDGGETSATLNEINKLLMYIINRFWTELHRLTETTTTKFNYIQLWS